MAIRAVARVAAAMKFQTNPEFYFHASIPYDQRNGRLRGEVSLSTIEGRKSEDRGVSKAKVALWHGQSWIKESQDPQPTSSGILGVDLGIKNIATDSEGRAYTNGQVEKVRTRFNELRGRLQSAGTRSARKHLKKLSGMERGFKWDVNHRI